MSKSRNLQRDNDWYKAYAEGLSTHNFESAAIALFTHVTDSTSVAQSCSHASKIGRRIAGLSQAIENDNQHEVAFIQAWEHRQSGWERGRRAKRAPHTPDVLRDRIITMESLVLAFKTATNMNIHVKTVAHPHIERATKATCRSREHLLALAN